MLLTDAVNEVILSVKYLDDIVAQVKDNILVITDNFGTVRKMFTDNDPDLEHKVRFFWSDFLKRRSHLLQERMRANDTTERWYEVHSPQGEVRCDNMESVLDTIKCHENYSVFYYTRQEIDPTKEDC